MAVSKMNIRTLITIPKELKTKLEQLAVRDDRSLNNLIIKILKEYAAHN